MFAVFKRQTLRLVGPYFIFGALVYHGLTEVVQRMTGQLSLYHVYAATADIDIWTVYAGFAMLLYTFGYVIVRKPARDHQTKFDVIMVFRILDWRVLVVLLVPLVAVVGTTGNKSTQVSQISTLTGLAQQFLILTLILATVGFIITHGNRILLPILVQLMVMTVAGSRLNIFIAAATTVFTLTLLRRAPSRRQLLATVAVASVLVLSVSGARTYFGRAQFGAASLTSRAQLLIDGLSESLQGNPNKLLGQSQPVGERLDGNSFPAAIIASERRGHEPVGLTTLRNNLLLAIPSFLNPAKLDSSEATRSEKAYLNEHFETQIEGDFLPTQLGAVVGYYGPFGLMLLSPLFGWILGFAERQFRRCLSPSRLVLCITLFTCVLNYSSGTDIWPLSFRGAIVVVIFLFLLRAVQGKSFWRKGEASDFADDSFIPLRAEVTAVGRPAISSQRPGRNVAQPRIHRV